MIRAKAFGEFKQVSTWKLAFLVAVKMKGMTVILKRRSAHSPLFRGCFYGWMLFLTFTLGVSANDPHPQKKPDKGNKNISASSSSKPNLNFVPSDTSPQAVLAEEELLTQFDIKIERIADTKALAPSGYARSKENMKFNVTVIPRAPLSRLVQLDVQLVATVQSDWNSEILGKVISNSQEEEYKQSFQVTFAKDAIQPVSKRLDLGAFYSNADYFFPGGKHLLRSISSVQKARSRC